MKKTARLSIKVVPGSSRDGIAGWLGDALKVWVTARAERGRANAAVEDILAEALGLSAADVRIIAGSSSARKVVKITGLSDVEVRERLARISE